MINVFFVQQELALAREELEKIKEAQDTQKVERLFANIADYLGKAFNKLLHSAQGCKGEELKIINDAKHKRKIDPLLQYLHHVRNANQHTTQHLADLEIISRIPVDFITLTKIGKDDNGNEVTTTEEHPMFPASLQLKAVKDSGVLYNPPIYHNGSALKKKFDPYEVASLGIKYFEGLIFKLKNVRN